MKIRVVGCHGSVAPGYRTTCYQVNDRFFIDAGSIASGLSPNAQANVTDVFLTHPHLDHIKDLCFLIENSASSDRPTLTIHSTDKIVKDIHSHIFNDVIWPDFSKVTLNENAGNPLLQFNAIEIGKPFQIEDVKVTAYPVNHPGNAVGYLLDDEITQVLITGDTGPCPTIWDVANNCPRLKAVYTEISFPSHMDNLARISGHYTLSQLLADLRRFKSSSVPIYISHFKPKFMNELLGEFHKNATPQMTLMHEGDEFEFA